MSPDRRFNTNTDLLGSSQDLETFLFATGRESLDKIQQGLQELEGPTCFYCRRGYSGRADVDHFIPFSRYPRDLAHNFVLAHPACNRSKSDSLASRQHLEAWIDRLGDRGDEIAEVRRRAGVLADGRTSRHVVTWAYTNALESGAHTWVGPNRYEEIAEDWLGLLV